MTDDLVQRIRAEADMASRAGQSAALHKIADDLAAQRGGEAVDREALAEGIAKAWWGIEWDHPSFLPSRRDASLNRAQAVIDLALGDALAARGDAAPTEAGRAEEVL